MQLLPWTLPLLAVLAVFHAPSLHAVQAIPFPAATTATNTGTGTAVGAEFYCPTVATKGEDRRPNNSTFRLVQLNAEWLFMDDADDCPGATCPWTTAALAQTHMSSIAQVIFDLNPDLINLCEVESCDELTMLTKNDLLAAEGFKPYMVQGTDSSTGQDVGMLTKIDPTSDLVRTDNRVAYPIPSTQCASTYTGTYGVSKHYITTLKLNGFNVAIIAAHLLAFPDDNNRCVEREAQASVLQQVVTSYIEKGFEVVLLGDFNDFDGDAVDRNGNMPISQVNAILKGQGTNWKLTNVASKIDQNDRYSEWYDENDDCVFELAENSMIDHVLISDGLLSKVTNVFIAHSEYSQSCSTTYSDHWPVVVDFTF
jgi:endonuclease/exonuclease/phosphatase family metal-dependent hydrolase